MFDTSAMVLAIGAGTVQVDIECLFMCLFHGIIGWGATQSNMEPSSTM